MGGVEAAEGGEGRGEESGLNRITASGTIDPGSAGWAKTSFIRRRESQIETALQYGEADTLVLVTDWID